MSTNLSQIQLTKEDQIIILLCILFCAAAFAFYTYAYSPKMIEIGQANSELQNKKAELNRMRLAAEQFDELDRKVKEVQLDLANFEKKVPTEEDIPSLLVQLQESALDSGLDIKSITKGKMEVIQGNNADTGGVTYSKFAINLSVSSDFASFVKFMNVLETWDRFVTVQNVSLAGSDDKLNVSFDMDAFVQSKGGAGL